MFTKCLIFQVTLPSRNKEKNTFSLRFFITCCQSGHTPNFLCKFHLMNVDYDSLRFQATNYFHFVILRKLQAIFICEGIGKIDGKNRFFIHTTVLILPKC